MNEHKFLFLLSWVSESDGACGENTRVSSQSDLEPEFFAGNEGVFACEVIAPTRTIAEHIGLSLAMQEGYTFEDTVSMCIVCPSELPRNIPSIRV